MKDEVSVSNESLNTPEAIIINPIIKAEPVINVTDFNEMPFGETEKLVKEQKITTIDAYIKLMQERLNRKSEQIRQIAELEIEKLVKINEEKIQLWQI